MRITLEIANITAELLRTLDERGDVEAVIESLIDHAAQGVYRPRSWERSWVCQAFGEDFLDRLEPGDPFGREGAVGNFFEKPKARS